MLIVFHELISGVQFSLIQLCADLLQVYERVPSFSILEPIISPFKCLIMVLFQTEFLFVVGLWSHKPYVSSFVEQLFHKVFLYHYLCVV